MGADVGFTDDELAQIGGDPFSMTVAGLRLARIANGVAELHGETAREMWKDVDSAAPIISDHERRARADLAGRADPRRARARQAARAPGRELWAAHQRDEARADRRDRTRAPASQLAARQAARSASRAARPRTSAPT